MSTTLSTTLIMVIIPLLIIQLVLCITALVSVVKKDVPGADKLLWVLIIIFVTTIGPILYFAVGSNMLDQKIAQREETEQNR